MREQYPCISKYPCPFAGYLYEQGMADDEASNPDGWGWVARYGRRLVGEDTQGFVWYVREDTEDEARARFSVFASELEGYEDDPTPVRLRVAFEDEDDGSRRVTWWPGSSTFHVEAAARLSEDPWVEVDAFTVYSREGEAGTPPSLDEAAETARAYLTRAGA